MLLLQECVKKMVICTHEFTATCNLCSSPTPLQPTSCLLLYLHVLSISLFAPSTLFALLFQLVLRRQRQGGKFSPSSHQLAITPEKLPNESIADERKKWDKLLFINTQRGKRVAYVGIMCVCVYCMCVKIVLKRGFKQAENFFIYKSYKQPNTSVPWLMD